MDLSVKHSLPPLPGRTLLAYVTDTDADNCYPKSNPQGVKKLKVGIGRMLEILKGILFIDLVLISTHAQASKQVK